MILIVFYRVLLLFLKEVLYSFVGGLVLCEEIIFSVVFLYVVLVYIM